MSTVKVNCIIKLEKHIDRSNLFDLQEYVREAICPNKHSDFNNIINVRVTFSGTFKIEAETSKICCQEYLFELRKCSRGLISD